MVARSDALMMSSLAPHRRAGKGTPLVLVHGFLGGAAQWQAEIEYFSETRDVIAPDLPGFGDANELHGCDRIEAMADYVIDLLNELEIGSFELLGHSMGGMIVQAIAAKIPDRIDRLVLYGTGPLGAMPNRFETIAQSRTRLLADGVETTIRRIGATWFVDREEALGLPVLTRIGERASPEAALQAFDAMEVWDGRCSLEYLFMPTLVLWGDTDRSYRWSQIEVLWQTLPNASLAVIPGSSHAAHLEKPKLFHAILEDFLSG
ncbi:alpha/beta fold hydrolase [Pseudohalocynthiibacter aestuariivivens]|uniref:Alpha/beta fold hydrolase n=1 Tax=Pseudohalocynthiibacter aestuariivivens TaxID=1591409 RepID=A0ABV5JCP8_9RHOB